MHQQITFSMFCDEFRSHDKNEQFTYQGKRHLFDYLEQYEEDCDTPYELDILELCCEYSEDDLASVLERYDLSSLKALEDFAHVIKYDNKTGLVLYRNY